MTARYPDASFFLLPARCWELFVGAYLSLIKTNSKFERNPFFRRNMSNLGMLLIAVSLLVIKDSFPHPSFPTILPILGTSLVILYSNHESLTTRILSSRFLVGIGLISYSLYLWHQPIFAFIKIVSVDKVQTSIKLVSIVVLFIVSFLTWKYIEKPFRDPKRVSSKTFWGILTTVILFLLSFSAYSFLNDGLPSRLNPISLQIYEQNKGVEFSRLSKDGVSCRNRLPGQPCRFGDESWVLLGDSHVGVFGPTLKKHVDESAQGLIDLTFDQCAFVDNTRFGTMGTCGKVNEVRWKEILSWTQKKTILVSADTALFPSAISEVTGLSVPLEQVVKDYGKNISKLLSLGHRVIVIYPVPDPGFGAQEYLVNSAMRSNFFGTKETIYSKIENEYENTLKRYSAYSELTDDKNLLRIYPAEILCPKNESSERKCIAIQNNGSIYNGSMHLSALGASMVLDQIFKDSEGK